MEQAAPVTQVVVQSSDMATKDDLQGAKNDLRREMKLWLGAGSALGTTLSGVLAAYIGPRQTAEALISAIGSLPL